MAQVYFSLADARAAIPAIAARLRTALSLRLMVRESANELSQSGYRVTPALLGARPRPEDEGTLTRAQAMYQAMLAEVEAIDSTGARVKSVERGLVDFPSWLDGKEDVVLCWQLGEPTVDHYHTARAGFAGRRPIGSHAFTARRTATHPRP